MLRLRLVTGCALLLLALSASLADAAGNMGRIREKAEEFTVDMTEAELKYAVDAKESKLERVHKDYDYLFSDSKVDDIEEELDKASTESEKRALRMLRAFIQENLLASQLVSTRDELRNLGFDDKELPKTGNIPFRQVRQLARFEPDRKTRKFAHVTVAGEFEIHNVYRNQMLVTAREATRRLGFESYPQLRAAIQDIDYDVLRTFAEEFLANTEAVYTAFLDEKAPDILDMKRSKIRRYDIEFLTTSAEMSDAIGKRKIKDVWQSLHGLRLPSSKKLVEVDWKDSDKRVGPGDVYAVDLEKEIIAAGRPTTRSMDLIYMLESYGRVSRLLSLTTDQWEFRRRGNGAHDLAAGYLMARVLQLPSFGTQALGLDDATATELAESRRMAELVALRLDAAQFLFDLLLYEEAAHLAQGKFNDHMETYLKVKHQQIDSEFFLEDFEFGAAERLTGRVLAAQLAAQLESRFGDGWWQSAEAGAFLREVWGRGSAQPLDTFASTHGFALFDSNALVEHLVASKTD